MKLYVSNAGVLKQYIRAKLSIKFGNISMAEDCIDELRTYWDQFNCSMVDVEDLDLLYEKLSAGVKLINHAKAAWYDQNR